MGNSLPITPKRFIDALASFMSSVNQCTVQLLSSMAKIPNLDKVSFYLENHLSMSFVYQFEQFQTSLDQFGQV